MTPEGAVARRERALFAALPAGGRVIEHAAHVPVPLELAWQVLYALADYGRWNPFIVAADAPRGLAPEARLTLRLRWRRGLRTTAAEVVTHVDPPADGAARLGWRFTGPLAAVGAVRAHRLQTLVADPDGGTRYRTREAFDGWGSGLLPLGFVSGHVLDQVQAYRQRCMALHDRGEQHDPAP